jgi:hypothetical protein
LTQNLRFWAKDPRLNAFDLAVDKNLYVVFAKFT